MSIKWSLVCVLLGIIIALQTLKKHKNNVCKTFSDYYSNRDENPNCYYNPDHELDVIAIIKRHGYPGETHHVTTDDGYILTVFRIPHGLKTNSSSGRPILIQHGVTINAGAFLMLGKKSLGFMLADAGYDVWLGNFRGNRYSRNHTYLDNQSRTYWNFSFHEMGIYDLPAEIGLVNRITKQKIIYIGFSMGTTAAYIYTATYPDKAKKQIDLFIGLAPVMFTKNIRLTYFGRIWTWLETPLGYITNGKIRPRPPMPLLVYKFLCFPYPIQIEMCQLLDMVFFGFNYEENDLETLPVSLQHNIDTASVKTVSHYVQLSFANNFQFYDHGEIENLRLYGTSSPPHYNLSKINIDSCLIYAVNDKIATIENVERLYRNLPKQSNSHKLYKIKDEKYNHIDFISGRNADHFLYKPIINLLRTGIFGYS